MNEGALSCTTAERKAFRAAYCQPASPARRDQEKLTEAHDLLAPVYNWFTEGLDTPVLKQAKVLLDELSGSPAAVVSRTLT